MPHTNREMTPDELRAQMDKTGRTAELRQAFAELAHTLTRRDALIELLRFGVPRVLVDDVGAIAHDETLTYITHGTIPAGLRAVRIEDIKANPDT